MSCSVMQCHAIANRCSTVHTVNVVGLARLVVVAWPLILLDAISTHVITRDGHTSRARGVIVESARLSRRTRDAYVPCASVCRSDDCCGL